MDINTGLARVGTHTQAWPSVASQTQTSPWPPRISVNPWRQQCPQTSTWLQVAAQTMGIPMAFGGSMDHGYQHRPNHSMTIHPDIALEAAWSTDINMASGGSAGQEPLAWSLGVTRAMDINVDLGCSRISDPHLDVSSLNLDTTVVPGGSAGYPQDSGAA